MLPRASLQLQIKKDLPQGWEPNPNIQKKIDEMISSIPWVNPIIKWIQKEELEAKNTETIDFDSKTPALNNTNL